MTSPLLFAAQSFYVEGSRALAVSRLAVAFHPMIRIFVSYHLVTRKTPCDMLPLSMLLFGLVYNDRKVSTMAFYPTWDGNWQPRASGVYHLSMPIERGGSRVARISLLLCLHAIHAHCMSVLMHLQLWPGYAAAARECSNLLPLG